MMTKWLMAGAAAVAAYVAFSITTWVWEGRLNREKQAAEQRQAEAIAFANEICRKNAAITKGTNDALFKGKNDVARQLADAYERLRDAGKAGACVPIAAASELGTHKARWPIAGGVVAESIAQLGADLDRCAVVANRCMGFVDEVWDAHSN